MFTDVGKVMMAFILATDFDFIVYMSKMAFFFFFFFFEAFFTPMAFLEYDRFSLSLLGTLYTPFPPSLVVMRLPGTKILCKGGKAAPVRHHVLGREVRNQSTCSALAEGVIDLV